MRKIILFLFTLFIGYWVFAQSPMGFSYQAVVRDADGNALVDQQVILRIKLTGIAGGQAYYTETHTETTNSHGLVNLVIGQGNNPQGTISGVPWSTEQIVLVVEMRGSSGSFLPMGSQWLQAVPYSLYSTESGNVSEVVSDPDADDDEPIFVVRNKDGQVVFAVYQSGVRVYVDDTDTKRPKGGFAVGGYSNSFGKEDEVNYLMVTPDSTRVSFRENDDGGKRPKGGFAVGGYSGAHSYLNVTPSHTQISFTDDGTKRPKGGFAVGGYSSSWGKEPQANYFMVTPDSTRVTFNDNDDGGKRPKGGFAVGGYSGAHNYLNVTPAITQLAFADDGSKRPKGGFAVGGYSHSKASVTDIIYLNPKNYFIGEGAGRSIALGEYNIFIGHEAGANTEGTHGDMYPTDGDNNIFIGYRSGYANVDGEQNVYMGTYSGEKNTSGTENTYVGAEAGRNNSGYGNTLLGSGAGYGPWNGLSSGYKNTFIGSSVGTATTTGNGNVFIGRESGNSNTSGSENVYIGHLAGRNNTTASGNVFIGSKAGWYSRQSNTLIIHNTADSEANIPANSLIYGSFASKTLRFNAHIGIKVGASVAYGLNVYLINETGSYGVRSMANYIGVYGSALGEGASATRYGIYGTASGGTTNYAGYFSGDVRITGTLYNPSDNRLKKDIKPIEPVLDKVLKLQGVNYLWKSENEFPDFVNANQEAKDLGNRFNFPEGVQLGVIAQDVEKLFPQLVHTDAEGVKSVDYIKFTPVFIEAFKEQQEMIDNQAKVNEELQHQLQSLRDEIEELKQLVKMIK